MFLDNVTCQLILNRIPVRLVKKRPMPDQILLVCYLVSFMVAVLQRNWYIAKVIHVLSIYYSVNDIDIIRHVMQFDDSILSYFE